jgi:predicted P-loop ATPase
MRALITQTSDSFRPPYEPSVESFPRRFIIYGCGNKKIFLHDQDGQRRYSILEVVQKINFKLLEEIRAQLWAEAWAIYSAGGLDYWEVKGNVENAAQFEIPNLMLERIETFLWQQKKVKHGTWKDKEAVYFVMSQVTDYLDMGKVGPNSSQMREVADTLIKLGCVRPGRSGSRHPETQVPAKWWIWEQKEC